jgi:hypothetical protein
MLILIEILQSGTQYLSISVMGGAQRSPEKYLRRIFHHFSALRVLDLFAGGVDSGGADFWGVSILGCRFYHPRVMNRSARVTIQGELRLWDRCYPFPGRSGATGLGKLPPGDSSRRRQPRI